MYKPAKTNPFYEAVLREEAAKKAAPASSGGFDFGNITSGIGDFLGNLGSSVVRMIPEAAGSFTRMVGDAPAIIESGIYDAYGNANKLLADDHLDLYRKLLQKIGGDNYTKENLLNESKRLEMLKNTDAVNNPLSPSAFTGNRVFDKYGTNEQNTLKDLSESPELDASGMGYLKPVLSLLAPKEKRGKDEGYLGDALNVGMLAAPVGKVAEGTGLASKVSSPFARGLLELPGIEAPTLKNAAKYIGGRAVTGGLQAGVMPLAQNIDKGQNLDFGQAGQSALYGAGFAGATAAPALLKPSLLKMDAAEVKPTSDDFELGFDKNAGIAEQSRLPQTQGTIKELPAKARQYAKTVMSLNDEVDKINKELDNLTTSKSRASLSSRNGNWFEKNGSNGYAGEGYAKAKALFEERQSLNNRIKANEQLVRRNIINADPDLKSKMEEFKLLSSDPDYIKQAEDIVGDVEAYRKDLIQEINSTVDSRMPVFEKPSPVIEASKFQKPSLELQQPRPVSDLHPVAPETLKPELATQSPDVLQPKLTEPSVPTEPVKSPVSGLEKIGTAAAPEVKTEKFFDKVKNKYDQFYTQAVDKFNPINKLGEKAGNKESTQLALAGHYGATSKAEAALEFDLKPILKEVDPDNLRELSVAQRDIELAGRDIKGSSKEAGEAAIEKLRSKLGDEGFAKVEQAAQKLRDYQSKLIEDNLVKTGIFSEEKWNQIKSQNQYYTPFKRVMDDVDEFLGVSPGKKNVGSVASQNVVQKIKGSDKAIVDPLESIVENTYKTIAVGQRQKVAQSIVKLEDKLPGLIRRMGDSEKVGTTPNISVFEDGKVVHYEVPADVAEAAKGLNTEALNGIIKLLSVPTKVFRATATGLNPEFMLPNVFRDLQSAFVNTGLNPLGFVKGLTHLIKKDAVYEDFLRSGAKQSSVSLDRPELTRTVADLTGKGAKTALIKKPVELLQRLGEYSEQPTRIAMFERELKQQLKKGVDPELARQRAAHVSQEGTVNFARSGSKMQAANALIAFMNARLQGTDKLLRSIKENPKTAIPRLALISVVPAILTTLYNQNFPGYFDDRIVNQNDKDNNFIMMLDNEHFLKIPKAEVGKFANPVEAFMNYLHEGGDNKSLDSLAKSFLALSPVQNPGDIIPTTLKPIIEGASNYSFFKNAPIVPEYKKDLPADLQFNSNTPAFYKMIGQATGTSPLQLENAASGYLTGYEKLAMPALNAATGVLRPDIKQADVKGEDVNRTPVARRFIGGAKRTEEEQLDIITNQVKGIDSQISAIKSANKRGDISDADAEKRILDLQGQQSKTLGAAASKYGDTVPSLSAFASVAPEDASKANRSFRTSMGFGAKKIAKPKLFKYKTAKTKKTKFKKSKVSKNPFKSKKA